MLLIVIYSFAFFTCNHEVIAYYDLSSKPIYVERFVKIMLGEFGAKQYCLGKCIFISISYFTFLFITDLV